MKRSAAVLKHFYCHVHFLNANSVFTIFRSRLYYSFLCKARFPLPELTARVNGPSWRVTGFHYPSTRPALTGNGNRALGTAEIWLRSAIASDVMMMLFSSATILLIKLYRYRSALVGCDICSCCCKAACRPHQSSRSADNTRSSQQGGVLLQWLERLAWSTVSSGDEQVSLVLLYFCASSICRGLVCGICCDLSWLEPCYCQVEHKPQTTCLMCTGVVVVVMLVSMGRMFESVCLSVCLSVRSITQKTNDPKLFKLGTRNDLGIP